MQMKNTAKAAAALLLTSSAASCGPKTAGLEAEPVPEPAGAILDSAPRGGARFLPRALVYRTNGDYAENVPISMSPSGEIISYPAPTDLAHTAPVPLAGGWFLDRRGVGTNTRFTRYTYKEYSSLKQPPTLDELRAAVIPGARVIQAWTLPMTSGEAAADTAAVNRLVREGLPGCCPVVNMPIVLPEE